MSVATLEGGTRGVGGLGMGTRDRLGEGGMEGVRNTEGMGMRELEPPDTEQMLPKIEQGHQRRCGKCWTKRMRIWQI